MKTFIFKKKYKHMNNKTLLMSIAITFITMYSAAQETGTYTDARDGNVYKTVTLGKQVWMAENLRYLPSIVGPETSSTTTSYYYVYDYSGTDVNAAKATSNYKTYGVLYNWTAAMAGSASNTKNPSGVQGVCPKGWHLPSDAEWTQLIDYLRGTSLAGGKLKETGTTHWTSPNNGATNQTGFTALPGGYCDGTFHVVGIGGYWWSATEYDATDAWSLSLDNYTSNAGKSFLYKALGFSIRCVKD
jgi:uncharacterized protein (TIGR02145 family)